MSKHYAMFSSTYLHHILIICHTLRVRKWIHTPQSSRSHLAVHSLLPWSLICWTTDLYEYNKAHDTGTETDKRFDENSMESTCKCVSTGNLLNTCKRIDISISSVCISMLTMLGGSLQEHTWCKFDALTLQNDSASFGDLYLFQRKYNCLHNLFQHTTSLASGNFALTSTSYVD